MKCASPPRGSDEIINIEGTRVRRISKSRSILLALLTGLVNSQSATAQTIIIPHTDRGTYSTIGFHNPTNPNYVVGDLSGFFGLSSDSDYRNFFIFDLSGVTQPIASAKLALSVLRVDLGPGYDSPDSSENYQLHDVTTPLATLVGGTGGVAAHADLGSGVAYGSRTMSATDMGTVVEITFNPAAIAALDAATGLVGVGGSLTSLDGVTNNEFTFGSSGDATDTTELRITLVPEPSNAILCCAASLAIMISSHCRRFGYRR